jgi:hypothetical protein
MYFVIMPRVNLIVILMTYVRYLYSISFPTVICLPNMLLFILWRDTTSELWIPVHSFYIAITILLLLALFIFLQTITFYHSIRIILCLQQISEIDNLIVSWEKVLGCVVCRFHVAAGEKLHADKLSGAIVRSAAKLAGINLRKCGSFSYWFDNLGFTLRENLLLFSS